MAVGTAKPQTNGHSETQYGTQVVNGLKKEEELEKSSVKKLSPQQEHVLRTFRLLIADLCEQFAGGHPGQVAQKGLYRLLTDC
jgi:dihydroxyacetone synthase